LEQISEPGYWFIDVTKTGLTASTDYEWGMMFRRATFKNFTPTGSTTGSQP